MNIVYFVRDISDCGGIQQTTCLVINSLVEKNTDYKISTISLYHKYETPFFDIDDSVERHSLFQHVVDTKKQFYLIKKRFKEILKEIKPDIIVIQGMAYANYLSNSNWKQNKVIVCEHGHFFMGGKYGLHWFGKRKALNKASAIVTLTNLDAENYRKNNQKGINITNIYNPSVSDNEEDWNYNIESKVIVSCGTLDRLKRFDHAIEAAAIVIKKYPDWKWYIYGDGKQKENLQEKIEKLNLENNVILKGYEKDKKTIYGNKALYVLTSEFEGFGMVLIEAMQFSLPVISYDINYGPKEIIENGKNGFLVENSQFINLGNKIIELIDNKNERINLSKQTRRTLDKFSVDKITDQWVNLFNKVQ